MILVPTALHAEVKNQDASQHVMDINNRPQAENFNLRDIDGKRVSLRKFQGKTVVISFWATWCKPCLRELGFLQTLRSKYPHQLEILAIATDGPNTAAKIPAAVEKLKRKVQHQTKGTENAFHMVTLHDEDGSVMAKWNPRGILPQSNYIDSKGRLAYAHEGFVAGDEEVIRKVIEGLIGEMKP
jgi:thiol-disulfide isomerase/thioredoxin